MYKSVSVVNMTDSMTPRSTMTYSTQRRVREYLDATRPLLHIPMLRPDMEWELESGNNQIPSVMTPTAAAGSGYFRPA